MDTKTEESLQEWTGPANAISAAKSLHGMTAAIPWMKTGMGMLRKTIEVDNFFKHILCARYRVNSFIYTGYLNFPSMNCCGCYLQFTNKETEGLLRNLPHIIKLVCQNQI